MRALYSLVIIALLFVGGGAVPQASAQTAPSLTITKPDASGGFIANGNDFASTVLGNPWDMSEAIPPDIDSTIDTDSVSIANGIWHGVARNNAPQLYLLTRGYGHGPDPCCSGAIHWKTNDGYVNPLNADVYHNLSVRMRLTRPAGAATSQARFIWYRDDSPSTPAESSVYFAGSDGWQTYTFDLKKLGTLSGSWSGTIRGLRFDPTNIPGTAIDIDWVRLTADQTVSPVGSAIQWQAANVPAGAVVSLTSVDSAGASCSIAQNVPAAQSGVSTNPCATQSGSYTIQARMGTDAAALSRNDPWDLAQAGDVTLTQITSAAFKQTLSNGQSGLTGTTSGTTPVIALVMPSGGIDASTFKQLAFNLKVTSALATTRQVSVFWQNAAGGTGTSTAVTLTSGTTQAIALDQSHATNWSGQITKLEIRLSVNRSGAPIELGPVTLTTSGTDTSIATASRTTTLTLNTVPQITITEPSTTSGPDFAATVLGDAWDFSNAQDVLHVFNTSMSLAGGFLSGVSTNGDPQLELNTRGQRIDTAKYHYLSFKLRFDDSMQPASQRARDLTLKVAEGWAPRIIWWGPGGPGVDHCTLAWFGGEPYETVYTTDLTTAPIENGTTSSCAAQGKPWAQATVNAVRFDPHEVGPPLGWVLDYLKLTGYQEAPSSLTIRWTTQDPDAGQTPSVDLFYTPNQDGSNPTPIATVPASAGSYAWNTSGLPRGATYYIVARITDGLNTTARVSSAPFITTGQAAASCSPRPNVGIQSAASGDGRLRVTVTASGAGTPLQSIRFGQAAGALIDIQGGQTGSAGGFTQTLPPATLSYTFFLRRATAGQSATAPFTVVDGCGDWPSLAGGGATAPF